MPPAAALKTKLLESIFTLLQSFDSWSLEHTPTDNNGLADAIAFMVTRDHRYASYINLPKVVLTGTEISL